jgi:long-chain fatty acid transport protein
MGGVGIAFPQDSITAAINPAGMGLIGDRIDLSLTYFRPNRNATIINHPTANGTYDANDTENFFIPEFGYNKELSDSYTLGLSVYANGGINTDYKDGIPLFGNPSAGVDLKQVFLVPTVTWKPSPDHSVGLSLVLAYQAFEAKGLQNFDSFSQSPDNLTNNGHDSSYGLGFKLGWIGKLTDYLSLGATYHSQTFMTEFHDYKGLFAEDGGFDIPAHYGIGLALNLTDSLLVAADYQRIEYGDIKSVNNPLLPNLLQSQLGNTNGAGFGWEDIDVIKVGVSYQWDQNLTLRAGYNHNSQPIPNSQTYFNIIAPGVVQDHATLGFTWIFNDQSELSFSYMHAFKNSVNGSNSIPNGGEANLEMYQNAIGLGYAIMF